MFCNFTKNISSVNKISISFEGT
ncbi:Protein CBG27024 [Caenorhabditis briggsae]|uniref:Protein CBG27024 n=1 Tax=Caenorhabditis briggsae TaxID=6238 RepID=B6IM90_CAEBR|nr:Protein CBG27024 [Caenorhabditis briggsae]CAS01020.1 Protein CBG27024 [Caenorhabditis briggsae]